MVFASENKVVAICSRSVSPDPLWNALEVGRRHVLYPFERKSNVIVILLPNFCYRWIANVEPMIIVFTDRKIIPFENL